MNIDAAVEIHFYDQDTCAIRYAFAARPEDVKVAEISAFSFVSIRMMYNLGYCDAGDSLAWAMYNAANSIEEFTHSPLPSLRIIKYPGYAGGRRFISNLRLTNNNTAFDFHAQGFGLLGRGIAYYAPMAVVGLIWDLARKRRNDAVYLKSLATAAATCSRMQKSRQISVANQIPLSLMVVASCCEELIEEYERIAQTPSREIGECDETGIRRRCPGCSHTVTFAAGAASTVKCAQCGAIVASNASHTVQWRPKCDGRMDSMPSTDFENGTLENVPVSEIVAKCDEMAEGANASVKNMSDKLPEGVLLPPTGGVPGVNGDAGTHAENVDGKGAVKAILCSRHDEVPSITLCPKCGDRIKDENTPCPTCRDEPDLATVTDRSACDAVSQPDSVGKAEATTRSVAPTSNSIADVRLAASALTASQRKWVAPLAFTAVVVMCGILTTVSMQWSSSPRHGSNTSNQSDTMSQAEHQLVRTPDTKHSDMTVKSGADGNTSESGPLVGSHSTPEIQDAQKESMSGSGDDSPGEHVSQSRNRDAAIQANKEGTSWFRTGRYHEAIACFTNAVESDYSYPNAYSNRAMTRLRLNDSKGAMEDYDRALELSPDNATIYGNRGFLFFRIGVYDGAIQDFTKAIVLRPTFAMAYRYRARAFRQMGEIDRAAADETRARELEGETSNIGVRE